jgi:hypothetical protein
MTYIITALLIMLFLACMHQANNMNKGTPNRLKCGLIFIMIAVIGLGYCVLNGFFRRLDLIEVVSTILVLGILLWLASDRRVGRPISR